MILWSTVLWQAMDSTYRIGIASMPVANINSSVYLQRFAVNYEYPVHFTNGLFDPANTTLKETLTRLERTRRHRCLVFVDEGIVNVRARLLAENESYAKVHACAV